MFNFEAILEGSSPQIPNRSGIYGFQSPNFFTTIRCECSEKAEQKFQLPRLGCPLKRRKNSRKGGLKGRRTVIRFLLRAAFWLTIVVLFLPADPAAQRNGGRAQVGTTEALSVAQAALEDAARFCARRPEACETGAQAFQTFGQKAQYGAKMLYEFLSDHFGNDHTASTGESPRLRKSYVMPGRDTLTPADVVPRWNGPESKQAARRPA